MYTKGFLKIVLLKNFFQRLRPPRNLRNLKPFWIMGLILPPYLRLLMLLSITTPMCLRLSNTHLRGNKRFKLAKMSFLFDSPPLNETVVISFSPLMNWLKLSHRWQMPNHQGWMKSLVNSIKLVGNLSVLTCTRFIRGNVEWLSRTNH